MAATIVQIRMDDELKEKSSKLFEDLGLDLPTAIRIFLKKSVAADGFPFEVRKEKPNADTLEAMREVEEMKLHPDSYKGYADVKSMFEEILA